MKTEAMFSATLWRWGGVVMATLSFALLALITLSVIHHTSLIIQSIWPLELASGRSISPAWSCRFPSSILQWSPTCAPWSGTTPITALGILLSGAAAVLPLAILIFALGQAGLSFLEVASEQLLTQRLARRTMRFALASLAFLIIAALSSAIAAGAMELFMDGFQIRDGHTARSVLATPPTSLAFEPIYRWLTPFLAAALALQAAILVKAAAIAEDHAQIV